MGRSGRTPLRAVSAGSVEGTCSEHLGEGVQRAKARPQIHGDPVAWHIHREQKETDEEVHKWLLRTATTSNCSTLTPDPKAPRIHILILRLVGTKIILYRALDDFGP